MARQRVFVGAFAGVLASVAIGVSIGCSSDGDAPAPKDESVSTGDRRVKPPNRDEVVTKAGPRPLEQKLQTMQTDFASRAPAERVKLYGDAIDALEATGIETSAMQPGDAAPMFTLSDASGREVALASLLKQGPAVLTWYRGGWCPYCNVQLSAMQDRLSDFTSRKATILAISPEPPDRAAATAQKGQIGFVLLSDAGNTVAAQYGLRYQIDDSLRAGFGPMLAEHNREDSATLPLSATYVVDQQGVIRWAFVKADYRERAEPEDILRALDAMSAR